MSSNFLERALKKEYATKTLATYENGFSIKRKAVPIYEAIEKYVLKINNLKGKLSEAISYISKDDGIIKSDIKAAYREMTEIVARASMENKYSKLYLPSLVDTYSSNSVVIKNGAISGNSNTTSGTNYIDLTSSNSSVVFHSSVDTVTGKIIKQNSSDEYMNKNFTIAPSTPINKVSELIISISLNNIESISNMIIDMDRSRNIKVFYREPGRQDFVFLSEDNGSKIVPTLGKSITEIKIVIQVKHSGKQYGGIFFNEFKVNRYSLSQDLYTDVKVDVNSNAKMVEVIRCDTDNNNIEYLVSVNGRSFKNATESPVCAYGVEDGEIYQLKATREYSLNTEGFMAFSIPVDTITMNSNEWIGFTGKDEYSETDIGSIEFFECYAVYRDIFKINIPANKIVYINGKSKSGTVIIYPGVHKIEIPKSDFTKNHSLKFYDKIEYDGATIRLTGQNGIVDSIPSVNDIFAQIETTASNIFSEYHGAIKQDSGIINLKTNRTVMYLGFKSINPKIDSVTLRINFKKSSKVATVNFVAIKTF